ncbi:MAG TPA: hypothetical protein HPP77_11295, partial [Candidatus Hydrogenedentes bacterium]|nr:hypothetical protein [Candidatus Hydrogenedentota bacterium]
VPCALADLRALPFQGGIDYITCLFDSINFMLTLDDVCRVIAEFARTVNETGIVYMDAITELMVRRHFDGQKWTEFSGHFKSTWDSRYDRATKITETRIRVNSGATTVLRERIYEQEEIEQACRDAGLKVLDVVDSQTWAAPDKNTIRKDYIAVRGNARSLKKTFKKVRRDIQRNLA